MNASKGNGNAIQTWTINAIKEANRKAGHHWFDPDTMRFFGTTVLSTVYQGAGGVYFVTRDKDYRGDKKYSVREFLPETGGVGSVGDVASYTKNGAINTAITFAAGADVTSGVRKTDEEYRPVTALEQFLHDLRAHSSDSALVNETDAASLMFEAKRHHRLMERMCSDPTFETDEEGQNQQVIKVRRKIVECVHRLGVMNVVFGGDPRGCTVKLVFKDGYTNDFGREGYCVPFRESD